MKTRTFRAADGRRVVSRMSDEQVAEREMVTMAAFIMPVVAILAFALAAGVF